MIVKFVDLRPNYTMKAFFTEAYRRVIESGQYIGGGEVTEFEVQFSEYVGASYGVGCASGFDALVLALKALATGRAYNEVIVPSNAPLPTWMAVSAIGATIVPVEPNPDTYVLDVEAIQNAITDRTLAVIPVHLYGQVVDVPKLMSWRAANFSYSGFWDMPFYILSDAAQAHGARYDEGDRVGSIEDAAAFSFYPTKNLGAYGDAGMVVTHDVDLVRHIEKIAKYGSGEYTGMNSRLDPLQAAFLEAKLPFLDAYNEMRVSQADYYYIYLRNIPEVVLPKLSDGYVAHQFVIRVKDRNGLIKHLNKRGIEVGIHYPVPPGKMKKYHSGRIAFPIAEQLADEVVSLPLGEHVRTNHALYVCNCIREYYEK